MVAELNLLFYTKASLQFVSFAKEESNGHQQ
jgi:hypothetical protein